MATLAINQMVFFSNTLLCTVTFTSTEHAKTSNKFCLLFLKLFLTTEHAQIFSSNGMFLLLLTAVRFNDFWSFALKKQTLKRTRLGPA